MYFDEISKLTDAQKELAKEYTAWENAVAMVSFSAESKGVARWRQRVLEDAFSSPAWLTMILR